MNTGFRTQARQIAVSTLYSLDFNNQLDGEVDLSVFPGMSEEEMGALDEEVVLFARYLVLGTLENRKHIDGLIAKYAINRPLEKIDYVDRNILRISFFQIENLKDTHPTIIIDQAVKLSQSLSNDVSYRFINGILDAFVKDGRRDSTEKQA